MSEEFGTVLTEQELKDRSSIVWPYKIFDPGRPVDTEEVDELLKGFIDIHVHGAPAGAWLKGRPTMVQNSIDASNSHMAALVFKDHNCMNNNCAIIVNELMQRLKEEKEARGLEFTPTRIYGGVTLNEPVGGINVKTVRAALGYGDCVSVWLPSLDSGYQRKLMGTDGGIYISENGELSGDMKAVLDVIAEYNDNTEGARCVLAACHVSNREKFDLLRYIKKNEMDIDVVIDHITQELTIATEEECLEMIELGAYLQFCETSCVPWTGMQNWIINFDYSFRLIKSLIKKKGTDHLVLASDSGQPGHEYIPGVRSFSKTLLAQGVSKEEIRAMSATVPGMLIGHK